MENTLGQFAQIATMGTAIYFAMLACNDMVYLYLRFHDNLSIDREDMQALARNCQFTLLLAGIAGMFHFLPFFLASGFLLCGVVFFQVLKINNLLKILERF